MGYLVLLLIFSVLPAFMGLTGPFYLVGALVLGAPVSRLRSRA